MYNMEKTLILMRGLPGSGKSTFAKMLCNKTFKNEDVYHLEIDMYFIDPVNGDYNFDVTKLKEAHQWCRDRVEGWMSLGSNVVVSNTFTQEWEMLPYFELGKKYDFKVISLIVENRHNGVSVHDVPIEVIDKMEDRFEIQLY